LDYSPRAGEPCYASTTQCGNEAELHRETAAALVKSFINTICRSNAATPGLVEMRAAKVRQRNILVYCAPLRSVRSHRVPLRQGALPRKRVTNYGLQIVELRLPSQCGSDAVAGGHDLGGIARPTARELHREIHAGDTLHGLVLSAR
jgi:hypothetical protein